jgi:hypothetical protein
MSSLEVDVRGTRLAGLLAAALTLAAVSTVAHDAPAQSKAAAAKVSKKSKLEAKKAYLMGKKKMSAGKYDGALEHFQKADELVPGAAPKYQIAVCFDKLGKAREAVGAYKAFVGVEPGKKYADRVDAAKKRITELEATLPAVITVSVMPDGVAGVTIKLDGADATGPDLEMAAGQHTIEVVADGHEPALEKVDVKGGETREITVTLKSNAVAPPPADDDDDDDDESDGVDPLMVGGFIGLGIGVVGGVLTAVFGVQALGASGDFDDTPTNELADDAEDSAVLADVFLGVALAGAIAGGVMITLALSGDDDGGDGGDDAEAKLQVVPYATPYGAGAAATISF